ncbi:OLC1v1007384C1 [Oldenlandia corymbosa var. corymbosa]|uniref:OLC1v1007384C1 n=1 Tax=Oldenlandia corymbosa var. corymbosa TaxID=529605 RepID=A0AAV1DJ25_OLDCO|nr:OLC1v1007384C1 [Oldenlandia corymbosa var. corymbosa]
MLKFQKSLKRFSPFLGRLTAAATYPGMLEERINCIVDEVKRSNGEIILFIDERHKLIGQAANVLKPHLSQGGPQGASTLKDYRELIMKDIALKQRFEVVQVNEPSIDETFEILSGLKTEIRGLSLRFILI